MKVGIVECCGFLEKNSLEDSIKNGRDVDVWILPELLCNTYMGCVTDSFNLSTAKEQTEDYFSFIQELCRKYNTSICFGYAEVEGESVVYNTASLINKDGLEILKHRKTMLWGNENDVFTSGETSCNVIEFQDIKIAISICYEVEFPEIIRNLALKGVDLILIPTACTGTFIGEVVVKCRAFENGIHIGVANRKGIEFGCDFPGGSSIFCPDGTIATSYKLSDDVSIFNLDFSNPSFEEARNRNPYLKDIHKLPKN